MKSGHLGIVVVAVTLHATAPFSGAQPVGVPAAQAASPSTEVKSLDFEFYRTRVEPIFLKGGLATHAATAVIWRQNSTRNRGPRPFGS